MTPVMIAIFSRRKSASKMPVTNRLQPLPPPCDLDMSVLGQAAVRGLDEVPDVRVEVPPDDRADGDEQHHLEHAVAQLTDVLHERHAAVRIVPLSGQPHTGPGPADYPDRPACPCQQAGARTAAGRAARQTAARPCRYGHAVAAAVLPLQVVDLPLQVGELLAWVCGRRRTGAGAGQGLRAGSAAARSAVAAAGTSPWSCRPGWPSSSCPCDGLLEDVHGLAERLGRTGQPPRAEQQQHHDQQDDDVWCAGIEHVSPIQPRCPQAEILVRSLHATPIEPGLPVGPASTGDIG